MRRTSILLLAFALTLTVACGDDDDKGSGNAIEDPDANGVGDAGDAGDPGDTGMESGDTGEEADAVEDVPLDLDHPPESVIYDFAGGCYAVGAVDGGASGTQWLAADGDGFAFTGASAEAGAKFVMQASDLGTYLLYDENGGYLSTNDGPILRQEALQSDVYLVDDTYISGAEWQLEFSTRISMRYQLRSRRTGGLLEDADGAADLVFEAAEGCAEHPEMALNAVGEVTRTTYEDGTLFGFVDTHSHILSNFGFGGGGIFHGAAFHRLGVEHAMGTCEPFHGPEGRADFLSWGIGENADPNIDDLLGLLATGLLEEPVHATDGWPTFSEWPDKNNSTHQTQYYKWIERAWMSGLRLVVQHAVSNEALCDIMADTGFQPTRWGCEDMLNIDRQLLEIRRMETYIDAQAGGPGEGWFRVVESPQEARAVISEGKLAVVLGIEVPNLFECYLTPRPGGPVCDAAHIEAQLDQYHDLGVRVLFPNHKFDNAFTPGDGQKGIMELANFIQTGHWSNYIEDCPEVDTVFDKGGVQFGGFNMPRDEYLSPAPNELIMLSMNPLSDLLPYAGQIMEPGLEGTWCQKAGLTDAGVTLVEGIMDRGMIIEIDHLPRRSYLEAFGILAEADYPAAATHGNINSGKLYSELKGVSKAGFGRCADTENPGSMANRFRARAELAEAAGLLATEGFGFDLNGLAGVPGPRFGDNANCATPQEDPVTYPFDSFAGDVTFEEPEMGERVVDFNTEGFVHIGMVPELIEDARRTGVTDEDLDILFKSAEGYLQMWERSEARAAARAGGE